MAQENDSGGDILLRLTSEQRLQIYREEKRRIGKTDPRVSRKIKFHFAVYLFGCIVLYSGIVNSLVELVRTGQLKYKPNPDSFYIFVKSAFILFAPYFTAFLCAFLCFLVLLPFLIFTRAKWYNDLIDYLQNWMNDDAK